MSQGSSGLGGGQNLRLHHPEIVNLPNLGQTEHLNHYYKTHHFNNNMMGLGLGSGMGLNNNNNPAPCSQAQNMCSQVTTPTGGGTTSGSILPSAMPLPQLGLHTSLKGLMGKSQNEPLLFKSGSKENVQETQI